MHAQKGMEVQLHTFSTSSMDGCQRHARAA